MNPENGGMPTRLSAGTRNSTASAGVVRTMPPRRVSRLEPPACSMRPPVRKRPVFATMWWIVYSTAAASPATVNSAEAHDHVADVADDLERQDALHVALGDGTEHAHQHRGPAPARAGGWPAGCVSGNSRVWVRMMAYTPTLVSRPAKIAVTGDGAVG